MSTYPVQTIASNTVLAPAMQVVLCDATSGTVTVTLPPSLSRENQRYLIKKTDSSTNSVVVDAHASETIDGATTKSIALQYGAMNLVCDGSNWYSDGGIAPHPAVTVTFTATTTYFYTHNYGTYPLVTVLDVDKNEIEVCVHHINVNTVALTFNGTITNGSLLLG